MKLALPRNWKFPPNALRKAGEEVERGWPGYMFGGHVRTSSVALIIVFLGVWWLHDSYEPSAKPPAQVPATQVVPPGFVPDPNYTWVPRSRLEQPPSTVTVTETPTVIPKTTNETTTPTSSPTTTSTAPPPFVLPPPFGPATTTTAPPETSPTQAPPPGLVPVPGPPLGPR